jgi:hypothetical protein
MSNLYTPERTKRVAFESIPAFSNPDYKDNSLVDVPINQLIVGDQDVCFRSRNFVFCSAWVFRNKRGINYGLFHATPDLRQLWPSMGKEADLEKIAGGQAILININGTPSQSFLENLKCSFLIETVASIHTGSRFDLIYQPNSNKILISTFRRFVDVFEAF